MTPWGMHGILPGMRPPMPTAHGPPPMAEEKSGAHAKAKMAKMNMQGHGKATANEDGAKKMRKWKAGDQQAVHSKAGDQLDAKGKGRNVKGKEKAAAVVPPPPPPVDK